MALIGWEPKLPVVYVSIKSEYDVALLKLGLYALSYSASRSKHMVLFHQQDLNVVLTHHCCLIEMLSEQSDGATAFLSPTYTWCRL